MKVHELIDQLNKMSPGAEVWVRVELPDGSGGHFWDELEVVSAAEKTIQTYAGPLDVVTLVHE
jgi:hypothetical protein